VADLAAVGDEGDVEGVDIVGFHHGFEDIVGVVGADFGTDEAEALGHPVDMGVHGHGGHAEGEAEDDGGGLGADAWETSEPGLGFRQGEVFEEGEVQVAALLFDEVEDLPDTGGFDPGEATGLDGALDTGDVAVSDGIEGAELAHEAVEGALGVVVGGVLGEDGEDDFLSGVQAAGVLEGAVGGAEEADDFGGGEPGAASLLDALAGSRFGAGFNGGHGRDDST